jgi:S-adenosylmethionine:tRNA ribosyltransferase-isomerase
VRTSDFNFDLPSDRIASHPSAIRDAARLMVVDRKTGLRKHASFRDIPSLLPPGSLLVVNDTRVLPARLRGRKATGGGMEIILTRRVAFAPAVGPGTEIWEALGRSIPRNVPQRTFRFGDDLAITVTERGERGALLVTVQPLQGVDVLSALERVGEVPLPPYIEAARRQAAPDGSDAPDQNGRATATDRERYQTVYAAAPGAVAAPTAGLHFTPALLQAVTDAGHTIASVTLHVGPGTFRPVESDDVEAHQMDGEWFHIPEATAQAVNRARATGQPIVAVGTTVVRTLEWAARAASDGAGEIRPGEGESRLFLVPGDQFRVVTDLVTNFHLPRSTLLMLVAAFAGREAILTAYQEAIDSGYRFYSYGDAMLLTYARDAS